MKLDQLVEDLGTVPEELLDLMTQKALSYNWNDEKFSAKERVFYGSKQVEAYCGHYLKIHDTCVLDYSLLSDLEPVIKFLENKLNFKKIKVYKCAVAALPPGAVISIHADPFVFTHVCHRIHFPIIENDKSYHVWFDKDMQINKQKMHRGHFYDFNNDIIHSGLNDPDNVENRIHIIFDVIEEEEFIKQGENMRMPLDFLVKKNVDALTYCKNNKDYNKFFNQAFYDSTMKYWRSRSNK